MAALDEKCDQGLELQIPLARRAIEAYQAGHFEAAQALAVSVCDTYLKQMFPPEPTGKNNKDIRIGYNEMATRLAIQEAQDASVTWALNIGYALAPAVQFLVHWWPGDEAEPPSPTITSCLHPQREHESHDQIERRDRNHVSYEHVCCPSAIR